MLAVIHAMSTGWQAAVFTLALAAFVIGGVLYAIAQPKPLRWAPVFVAAGLACWVLVPLWNAAVA